MFLIGQTKNRGFLNPIKTYWACSQNSSFTHCSQNITKRNEKATLSIVYGHNLFQCVALFLNHGFLNFLVKNNF